MSKRTACLAGVAAIVLSAAACGSSASSSPGSGSSVNTITKTPGVKSGGNLIVDEGKGFAGDWPYGFDPATDVTGSANQDYFDAVYGQLFDLGPNGKIQPDLATGYKFSPDAKTVTITLRKGVKFSDGTPFNAQAVYWNWIRDLGPTAVKAGIESQWSVAHTSPKNIASPVVKNAIQVTGPYTLAVHQVVPNGAFINQLSDAIANWIASPAAFKKEGAKKFAQYPVGAGPFTVVSDTYNSQLVVKKNPNYWEPGHPYLDQITFKAVSGDEAGYESLVSGQGQVYQDLSTTQILNQASSNSKLQVENNPGTSPYDLQLNTANPVFSNPKARQAIYAATNFAPILNKVFGNRYPVVQGFTGPGGICYNPKVPGYQGYDPALAKKLIAASGLNKQTFTLGTINSSPVAINTTEALQTEWQQLGLKVKIASYPLDGLIQAFEANGGKSWDAMVQTAGAQDPADGVGVNFRFGSKSPFTGVHDPKLDKLLAQAQSSANVAQRCPYYQQAAEYIAKNYYGPFYFSFNPSNMSVPGVVGPGLTSPLPSAAVVPVIPWQDVYYNPGS
ncbi:MAG: ABC transporter substrate-binding protein [Streptosporangiales bacterium]|jgi:peptide/nickel transport system substrate-binding protein|nr:ABC transporter substrate-binding protein [Streptosporangiales bacterium]